MIEEGGDSGNEGEYQTTDIPTELRNMHACMRCGLIKTLDQVRLISKFI